MALWRYSNRRSEAQCIGWALPKMRLRDGRSVVAAFGVSESLEFESDGVNDMPGVMSTPASKRISGVGRDCIPSLAWAWTSCNLASKPPAKDIRISSGEASWRGHCLKDSGSSSSRAKTSLDRPESCLYAFSRLSFRAGGTSEGSENGCSSRRTRSLRLMNVVVFV